MASNPRGTPEECPGTPPSEPIDRRAFTRLHSDGRRLIQGWLRRAERRLETRPEEPFEPFIFAWIAFNGWAACCSGTERDADLVAAMAADPSLQSEFQALLDDDLAFREAAGTFRGQWPIFKAIELRRRGLLQPPRNRHRQELVAYYLRVDPAIVRAPKCYARHLSDNTPCPLDWPHTLAATYRVRCNLFHGEKAAHSEMDTAIVTAAVRTLVPFIARLLISRRGL